MPQSYKSPNQIDSRLLVKAKRLSDDDKRRADNNASAAWVRKQSLQIKEAHKQTTIRTQSLLLKEATHKAALYKIAREIIAKKASESGFPDKIWKSKSDWANAFLRAGEIIRKKPV